MKAVSGLSGIDSISMDMKDKKMTVIGDVDPIKVVSKLKKQWHTQILTVGPAKEEKKDEGRKDDDNKKKESEQIAELVRAYNAYNHHMAMYYLPDESPNSCIIC